MKKKILFIKASNIDVRTQKFINSLKGNEYQLYFAGWKRENIIENSNIFSYFWLLKHAPSQKPFLVGYYLIWMIKLFFFLLRNHKKFDYIYSINFECAFPTFLAYKITKKQYYYDIFDEFAISYKFPEKIKLLIKKIDKRVKNNATTVIHVDQNRLSKNEKNYIIIQNTPVDFYNKNYTYKTPKKKIAITGWLVERRGVYSITKFIKNNPHIHFIFIGESPKQIQYHLQNIIKQYTNITLHPYLPQNSVFELINDVSAIFALYDPSIEINRKAASNKLYDAMMLGIPLITNRGIKMADYVVDNNIGIVVDYSYNKSWDSIIELLDDKSNLKEKGLNGRDIYTKEFEFNNIAKRKFLPLFRNTKC
ncbi:hypothetical protein DID75_00145 [Candidatus Marinamargulisbacteria bacterium SCGC AG-410-N11]|nr:hypothetical protein DID75_00145 [Candidatus Marinamargulisbacteria bacterium SCGC AG-410-N11]